MDERTIHIPNPDVEPLQSSRLTGDATESDIESIRQRTAVYVYEWPVRLWHWLNALAILVLCVTGWFIGSPPPTMQIDEANYQFVFGYIRFAHFTAGLLMMVMFIGRIYWAFVGNRHARQLFRLPVWNKRWWYEVYFELRWYMFLEPEPKKYVGHNPLAQAAMFFFITIGIAYMVGTGLALYGEGLGAGSWADTLFGWAIPLVGGSQAMHSLHHLGMWTIIVFIIIHVYAAIREDILSRQSMVSTMISGHRTFKDDKPD
ncbi:Ni/Fe-hydrogenase, b-type cytochrome subunit [Roseibacterium beibuensis]|uniref:Ni/Fe-hydrogenase, b-type cytochrome subunit n=1 Tax=[Roseibacterium] beibuensis TaxID=1193142 RepID=A0ABP9KWG1_9RHOB|nr:Ni/Fe-hydrogenase, b-type cytochrome subunit [Roseibacterium beibuensis]MCS6622008.1 Ni/Fe-hydrogenase, b-type cytochrome subunit [Roseibacterium beibuensis]